MSLSKVLSPPRKLYVFFNTEGDIKIKEYKEKHCKEGITQVMYFTPLVDSEFDMVATTVGRTNIIDDIAKVGRQRALIEFCSARRVKKFGIVYGPVLGDSLLIYTNNDEIADLLKWWCRIFMGAIDSMEPSECISKLAHLEKELKDHLFQLVDILPSCTVCYMRSWGDGPLIEHWNLFARELQIHQPNPKEFVSVPTATINNIIEALKFNPDAKNLVDELHNHLDTAAALLSRAKLQQHPDPKNFWLTEEKMAEIAHREKNLPLALKKVDEGSESVLGAARTLQLNRQTLKIKMKQAGVKSQFKSGGQLKTGKPDSLDDAFELASTRVVGVADVARSKGVKRTTLAMRMSRAGIRSSVSVGRQPSYTYSQEDMDEAIRMCEAGEMAPKEAASHFSIPSGTLGSRMFRRKQQQRK